MLDYSKTRVHRSLERAIASGSNITAEGMCLVADISSGTLAVKPSSGTSTEIFVGVSTSQQLHQATIAFVEDVVPASGTATLTHAPVSGTYRFYNVTESAAMTENGALGANQYTVSTTTGVANFNSAQNGDTIRVWYRYSPTFLQQREIQGDILPGGAASQVYGNVGVISYGDVFTDMYDTAVDWSAASPAIKTGASGLFTIGGSGAAISAVVLQVPGPGTDGQFLGLLIRE